MGLCCLAPYFACVSPAHSYVYTVYRYDSNVVEIYIYLKKNHHIPICGMNFDVTADLLSLHPIQMITGDPNSGAQWDFSNELFCAYNGGNSAAETLSTDCFHSPHRFVMAEVEGWNCGGCERFLDTWNIRRHFCQELFAVFLRAFWAVIEWGAFLRMDSKCFTYSIPQKMELDIKHEQNLIFPMRAG